MKRYAHVFDNLAKRVHPRDMTTTPTYYYNPLIQASYRALVQGAPSIQVIWDDAHGIYTGTYCGKQSFDQAWKTFQKYAPEEFDRYVEEFNDHWRPSVKES